MDKANNKNGTVSILMNPVVARIIMVLFILLAAVFGTHKAFSKMTKEAEVLFYEGELGDGLGSCTDIKRCFESTSNLLVIGRNAYGESGTESMQVLTAQLAKIEKIEKADDWIRELRSLLENLEPYYEELQEAKLSEYDRTMRDKLFRDIEENVARVAGDPYQKAAEEMNQRLSTFPANILRYAAGVKNLEMW